MPDWLENPGHENDQSGWACNSSQRSLNRSIGKKRLPDGTVYKDRHLQISGRLPHLIESWIIDANKLFRPALAEDKVLVSSEPLRPFAPLFVCILNQFGLSF